MSTSNVDDGGGVVIVGAPRRRPPMPLDPRAASSAGARGAARRDGPRRTPPRSGSDVWRPSGEEWAARTRRRYATSVTCRTIRPPRCALGHLDPDLEADGRGEENVSTQPGDAR